MWKIVFSVLAAVFAVGYAGMMPGGFQDADPTSPSVQNALNFAVVKHNLRSNNLFVSQAIRVVKARSQVSNVFLFFFVNVCILYFTIKTG